MDDKRIEREFTTQEKEYMRRLGGCICTFVAIVAGLAVGIVLSILF